MLNAQKMYGVSGIVFIMIAPTKNTFERLHDNPNFILWQYWKFELTIRMIAR